MTTNAFALDLGQTSYFIAVSQRSWERMSPAAREVLEREVEALGNRIWNANEAEAQEALECITGTGDCALGESAALKLVEPDTASDEARLAALTTSVLPRWLERCGKACAAEWNATVGQIVGVEAKHP